MEKNKDNEIGNDVIDALINVVSNIRSEYPQNAYTAIEELHPILDPCRKKLIGEYLSVVAEIEKDKKVLNEKRIREKRKDNLKKLMLPLVRLNKLHPAGENPYLKEDSTYPFIDETIRIDKEIDINRLKNDKDKYSIRLNENRLLLDPDEENIIIREEYRKYMEKKREKDAKAKELGRSIIPITLSDEGHTSIRELYKKWLPTLTKDKITSKDLLDQMLVCFAIKRALNGDKTAIDTLYKLYEKTAVAIAESMARKRGTLDASSRLTKTKMFIKEENGVEIIKKDPDLEEIKQSAMVQLRLFISGFKPSSFIDSLLKDNETFFPLPKWIEKFYFWYLSEYVPKKIDKIMKRPPDRWDGVAIDILFNVFSPINACTFWKSTPRRIMKFNSYSFRPNKKTNLTTWLFGTKTNKMQGKFYQFMKEELKDYNTEEIPHDFLDEGEDEDEDFKIRQKVEEKVEEKAKEDSEKLNLDIEQAIHILRKRGFSERDIEIVTKKLRGFSHKEIADEHNLSRRQIINIYNKFKSLYQ